MTKSKRQNKTLPQLSGVTRFSISLPQSLATDLDQMVKQKGYDNRSNAIADMIRNELVVHRHDVGSIESAGTLTLIYDHHKPNLQAILGEIQHDHHETIISTMHVHLDHHNCLEVLVMRGKASDIQTIADSLITAKGIKHGKLVLTTTGQEFS